MPVKVVGLGKLSPDAAEQAVKWGEIFERRGLQGRKYIPPTADAPGLVIRGDGEYITVIPSAEPLPKTRGILPATQLKIAYVTHGVISSYFLGPPGDVEPGDPDGLEKKPVKVRKSNSYDTRFREDEAPQVSLSSAATAGDLGEYLTGAQLGEHGGKWSHFVTLKSSQYSGWARAAVQTALGIGYGQDGLNNKARELYQHVGYWFHSQRSDGVIFPEPDVTGDQPGFTPPAPANIRIDKIRGRYLVAPLLVWNDSYEPSLQEGETLSRDAAWERYLGIAKSYQEDDLREEDVFDPIKGVIRKFSGIPLGHTLFSAPTNLPSNEGGVIKALEQRIDSGIITSFDIQTGFADGVYLAKYHPWAFSYYEPVASHVSFEYDGNKGIYKGKLNWVRFDIKENELPKRTASYPRLQKYLSIWVSRDGIDYLAARSYQQRLEDNVMKGFEARLASDDALDSKEVLIDILKEKVKDEYKIYTLSVEAEVLKEGYFVNWKNGSHQVMDCEIKVPDYYVGACVSIGSPSIDVDDVPPESRNIQAISPLDIFFTLDGGVIQSEMVSLSPGDTSSESVGGFDQCSISNWVRVDTTKDTSNPIFRFVRTNVMDLSSNARRGFETVTENQVEPLFDTYSIGDFLTDPGKGVISKYKIFRQKGTTSDHALTQGGTGALFPKWEREAVYIAHTSHGKLQGTKRIKYTNPTITYAYRALYERCFPGYGARSTEYFQCQQEGFSCPSSIAQTYGYFPRQVTFPEYSFNSTGCTEMWGLEEPIFSQCQDADALHNSTSGLSATNPPDSIETVPPSLSAFVYAHSSTLGEKYEKATNIENKESADLSYFWTNPSPDPVTGALAYFNAVASSIGDKVLVSYSDIGDSTMYIVGLDEEDDRREYVSPAASFIGNALTKNPGNEE